MSLLEDKIYVNVSGKNKQYYLNKGYKIPTHIDKKGRVKADLGAKILVKIEDLPNSSAQKVKVRCDHCGKEYELRYVDYLRRNHNGINYCLACSKIVLNTGINNPTYKPYLTEEERKRNHLDSKVRLWSKKVMARDNYTCQCCGKNNIIINSHHLDGYNWCKDKRYEVSNGITLCDNCHNNFHSIYGYGNNTREQFEEWIGHAIGELENYNGELPTTRKIYCIEENKIYDSAVELSKIIKVDNSKIYDCCNKKERTCKRKYKLKDGTMKESKVIQRCKTIKGKHYVWYEDWLKQNKNSE